MFCSIIGLTTKCSQNFPAEFLSRQSLPKHFLTSEDTTPCPSWRILGQRSNPRILWVVSHHGSKKRYRGFEVHLPRPKTTGNKTRDQNLRKGLRRRPPQSPRTFKDNGLRFILRLIKLNHRVPSLTVPFTRPSVSHSKKLRKYYTPPSLPRRKHV